MQTTSRHVPWLAAVALMGAAGPALGADLHYFRTTSVQYTSTSNSWGWYTVLRANGELAAPSCGAFSNLNGAPVFFSADGTLFQGTLVHSNDSWYYYQYSDSLRTYKVVVNGDKGIWRVEYTGRDADVLTPIDVTFTLIVDGLGASESIQLAPDTTGTYGYIYNPAPAPMACFGPSNFTFKQTWNGWGYTQGYIQIIGYYKVSDCSQAWRQRLSSEPVVLMMDDTIISVPAGGLQNPSGDWYRYDLVHPLGKIEMRIHATSGYFWAKIYDANLDLVTPEDGVEVTMQVGDQIGFKDVVVVGGALTSTSNQWTYTAPGTVCP